MFANKPFLDTPEKLILIGVFPIVLAEKMPKYILPQSARNKNTVIKGVRLSLLSHSLSEISVIDADIKYEVSLYKVFTLLLWRLNIGYVSPDSKFVPS